MWSHFEVSFFRLSRHYVHIQCCNSSHVFHFVSALDCVHSRLA